MDNTKDKPTKSSDEPNFLWPVDDNFDLAKWKAEREVLRKNLAEYEEKVVEAKKAKAAREAAKEERKAKALAKRDQPTKLKSIINTKKDDIIRTKVSEREVVPMADNLKKTALVDSLLKANLGSKDDHTGAYAAGAVDLVADQVLVEFPDLDRKMIKGLIYSRRSILAKVARETVATV